jgi:hypothetical protein
LDSPLKDSWINKIQNELFHNTIGKGIDNYQNWLSSSWSGGQPKEENENSITQGV